MTTVTTEPPTADSNRPLLVEDDTTQARMIEGMLGTAGSSFQITHLGPVVTAADTAMYRAKHEQYKGYGDALRA